MSFVFKLLFVFGITFMVSAKEQIVDSDEIEMLQKKLCDNNIRKDSRDQMIDCMEENLPFVLLEAMDSCIYEAIPNAFTREEIQKSLCGSVDNRAKVHRCMLKKQNQIDKVLSKQEIRDKFNLYKTCVDSAAAKSQ